MSTTTTTNIRLTKDNADEPVKNFRTHSNANMDIIDAQIKALVDAMDNAKALLGELGVDSGGNPLVSAAAARSSLDAAQSEGATNSLYDAEQAIAANASDITALETVVAKSSGAKDGQFLVYGTKSDGNQWCALQSGKRSDTMYRLQLTETGTVNVYSVDSGSTSFVLKDRLSPIITKTKTVTGTLASQRQLYVSLPTVSGYVPIACTADIASYGNTALLILSQPVAYNGGWRTRFFNADPTNTATLDCTVTTYYVKTA